MDCEKKLELLHTADDHRYQHLDFAARMFTHNLRSPLAGIKMLLPMLEKGTAEEKEDVLKQISDSVINLARQVDDMSVTMLDYRHLLDEPENTDIEYLLEKSHETAQARGLVLDINLDECPNIYCRQPLMEVVFAEIMRNSLTYRHPDREPELKIVSRKGEGACYLSFADNGIGFDSAEQNKDLFKMYKQKRPELRPEAAGLGLYRIKNIVEIQGGKVSLESTEGKGTTLYLELPDEDIIH